MARPDKASAVAELTEGFRSSSAVLLTEYRGLTVAQLKDLRRALGEDVTYAVVKNTLTKIAARAAAVPPGLEDLLAGPSAIAFVSGDPVEAAKGLRDFAKAHPLLVIKGGVMDGRSLSPDEIRKLADLESREVLLAKLAGAMKASLSGAVSLFAAPLSQTARLIEALRQKAEQDPTILRGGTGTATAPPEPHPEPTAEQVAQPQGDDAAVALVGSGAQTPSTEAEAPQAVAAETGSTEAGSTEAGSAEAGSTETDGAEPDSTEATPTDSTSESTEPESTDAPSTEPDSSQARENTEG